MWNVLLKRFFKGFKVFVFGFFLFSMFALVDKKYNVYARDLIPNMRVSSERPINCTVGAEFNLLFETTDPTYTYISPFFTLDEEGKKIIDLTTLDSSADYSSSQIGDGRCDEGNPSCVRVHIKCKKVGSLKFDALVSSLKNVEHNDVVVNVFEFPEKKTYFSGNLDEDGGYTCEAGTKITSSIVINKLPVWNAGWGPVPVADKYIIEDESVATISGDSLFTDDTNTRYVNFEIDCKNVGTTKLKIGPFDSSGGGFFTGDGDYIYNSVGGLSYMEADVNVIKGSGEIEVPDTGMNSSLIYMVCGFLSLLIGGFVIIPIILKKNVSHKY